MLKWRRFQGSRSLLLKIRAVIFFQVIRVLGLLGALDPHKHKMNLGLIQKSEVKAVYSVSDSKANQDASQPGME